MNSLVAEQEVIARHVQVTKTELAVDLHDGRRIIVPITWYPRLMHASPKERKNWQLLGDGYAIEWPELDEHIGVSGLLMGQRSGESKKSLRRWLINKQRATSKRRQHPRAGIDSKAVRI